MHDGADLNSEVKDASHECAGALICEYEEGLEKVGKYVARYLAIRQRRLLLAAKLQSEEQKMSDVDDDVASEASSNFSGMNAYTRGKGSAASVSTGADSRARESRRQRNRGKIWAGSPDETALVEHLKGMSFTRGSHMRNQIAVGLPTDARRGRTCQEIAADVQNFRLSRTAAVKLAEETSSNSVVVEREQTLERYLQRTRP